MKAVWNIPRLESITYPQLRDDIEVDVAIIGGGATGLATAFKLIEAGQRVAVLEALRIGEGCTGRSTGNLYGTLSEGLANMRKTRSDDVIRRVAAVRMHAIDFIEETTTRFAIDCQFARRPLYICVRTPNATKERKLEAEYEALVTAGLTATLVDDVPELPFAVHRAIRIENQAQYNPLRYAAGLAKAIINRNGLIFESSRVVDVDAGEGLVKTEAAQVKARDIVYATHTPKGINLLQAEMEPSREYGVSAELNDGAYPQGIFWILDDSKSLRSYHYDGKQYLVLIGEKHKTGHGTLGKGHFDKLKNYARRHFDVASFEHEWSAQQYKPADCLPYIGRSGHNNVHVATGYAANGLIWGTVAADILTTEILGHKSHDNELFNPRRFTPIRSAKNWIKENADVAKHLVRDYLSYDKAHSLEQVPPGKGEIVNVDGKNFAVYRSTENRLSVLSAECPHMKCLVAWNAAETSWDCPCHGSRFTPQGNVIEGPAYQGLSPCDISPKQTERSSSDS